MIIDIDLLRKTYIICNLIKLLLNIFFNLSDFIKNKLNFNEIIGEGFNSSKNIVNVMIQSIRML